MHIKKTLAGEQLVCKSGGAYLFLWYKGFPNPHEIREMRR